MNGTDIPHDCVCEVCHASLTERLKEELAAVTKELKITETAWLGVEDLLAITRKELAAVTKERDELIRKLSTKPTP